LSKAQKNVVIVGAGARGNKVFADLISRFDTGFVTRGVVEPDEAKRETFRVRYDIPEENVFTSIEEFLEAPRFGDIVFICTPDPTHFSLCKAVSEKGYDILLEKPLATTLPDSLALLDVEQTHKNRIFVAHVLRYSIFFRSIKEIIQSKRLGEVQDIYLSENVGHWHFAHSYVRGNWRRSDQAAPIILTKSSHDLDILFWLLEQRVLSVVSYGSLNYFRPEHAPAEAADRCVECPLQDDCLYSATTFYLNEEPDWPYSVIAPPPDSLEARRKAVEEGQYGRCVWKCDNDVCDNQTVVLELESGAHATFSLYAHTADNTRKVKILFERGELAGDLRSNDLVISHFTGKPYEFREEKVTLGAPTDSHGGGDLQLLYALHDHLTSGEHEEIMTSLKSSVTSHVLAFLAEESRTSENRKLPIPEIFREEESTAPVGTVSDS